METIENLKAENRYMKAQIEALKQNPFASLRQPDEKLEAYKCQGITCRGAGQCARYEPFGTSLNCGAFWLRRDDVHSEFCDCFIPKDQS